MIKDLAVKAEQEKVIKLMSQILDFNQQTEVKIESIIEEIGIRKFFFEIDSLFFSDEIKEKINALKEIIQNIDGYIQATNRTKVGDINDK